MCALTQHCFTGACPSDVSDKEEEAAVTRSFKRAYANVDDEILAESQAQGRLDGSTAVASLQYGLKLYVANAGNARAGVLFVCLLMGGVA